MTKEQWKAVEQKVLLYPYTYDCKAAGGRPCAESEHAAAQDASCDRCVCGWKD